MPEYTHPTNAKGPTYAGGRLVYPGETVSSEVPVGYVDPPVNDTVDSEGNAIAPDSMAQTLGYNGAGKLATITATDGTNSWVQTLTYTAGRLSSVSQWVKQ